MRLRPDRASMGSYAKAKEPDKGIAGLPARAGVGYVSLPELGNLFLDYDDGSERYERFLALAAPVLFDRLEGIAGPVCLMCAEKRVCECHRRHIAAHLERAKAGRSRTSSESQAAVSRRRVIPLSAHAA